MSYDLVVFDPKLAPIERAEFLKWYDAECEWVEQQIEPLSDLGELFDYDVDITTQALKDWFFDIIKEFPTANGQFAPYEPPDDNTSAEYSFGKGHIYVNFSWAKAEAARECTMRLAEKHRIGFFDVSSDQSGVWLPDATGRLVLSHADE